MLIFKKKYFFCINYFYIALQGAFINAADKQYYPPYTGFYQTYGAQIPVLNVPQASINPFQTPFYLPNPYITAADVNPHFYSISQPGYPSITFPFYAPQPIGFGHQSLISGTFCNPNEPQSLSTPLSCSSISNSANSEGYSSDIATSVEENLSKHHRDKKRQLVEDDSLIPPAKKAKTKRVNDHYPKNLPTSINRILTDYAHSYQENSEKPVSEAFFNLAKKYKIKDLDAGIADVKRKNDLSIPELYFLNLLHKKVKKTKESDDSKHRTPYAQELGRRIRKLSSKNPTDNQIEAWLQSERQKIPGEKSFYALHQILRLSDHDILLKEKAWELYLQNEYLEYFTNEDIELLYKIHKYKANPAEPDDDLLKELSQKEKQKLQEDLQLLLQKTILKEEQKLLIQRVLTGLELKSQVQ